MESIKNIAIALCKVQSELTGALKDNTNPYFNADYATLESLWDSIRKPLTDNGLSVLQIPCEINGAPGLETILMHISGEYISRKTPLVLTKQDPQAYGSAMTYFRRYALAAVVGQVQVDDDANDAMPAQKQTGSKPIVVSGDPSEYVISFGKFKGKKVSDIDMYKLNDWVQFLKSNKELSGKALEAANFAEKYLSTRAVK